MSGKTESIPIVHYNPPASPLSGVEVVRIASLRQRASASAEAFGAIQRPTFHLLMRIDSGHGSHQVDFVTHELEPGTVVWVRPGQVQQWGDLASIDGTLVLVESSFAAQLVDLRTATAIRHGEAVWNAALPGLEEAHRAFDDLDDDYQQAIRAADETSVEIVRYRFALLVLRLVAIRTDIGEPPSSTLTTTFSRFREEVERDFASHHSVGVFAAKLGYSMSTIARATQAVARRSPKAYLDDRIVLEAKRLLAHSDATVATISATLGFDEAANFSKFFKRRAGLLPSEFRREGKTTGKIAGQRGAAETGETA